MNRQNRQNRQNQSGGTAEANRHHPVRVAVAAVVIPEAPRPPEFHECFGPAADLTPAEARQLAIKQTAIRVIAGLEDRSLRVLAREIGCHHNAIAKAIAFICDRIGMRKWRVPDSTRRSLSAARRRHLAGITPAAPAANPARDGRPPHALPPAA